jgi:hypothetical protein
MFAGGAVAIEVGPKEGSTWRRRTLWIGTVVGAAGAVVLPFIGGGSSVHFYTDVGARAGYALFAAAAFAIFGAAIGWALASIVVYFVGRWVER